MVKKDKNKQLPASVANKISLESLQSAVSVQWRPCGYRHHVLILHNSFCPQVLSILKYSMNNSSCWMFFFWFVCFVCFVYLFFKTHRSVRTAFSSPRLPHAGPGSDQQWVSHQGPSNTQKGGRGGQWGGLAPFCGPVQPQDLCQSTTIGSESVRHLLEMEPDNP